MPEVPATNPRWHLEGQTVTVHIPMRLQRRGGRKLIIAPKDAEAWAPPVPRPDSTLVRALVRAHRWRRLLESGTYATISDLAKAEKVNDSYVCRMLRLNLLAPGIVEAILDGRQPKGLQLKDLLRNLPTEWTEQANAFGLPIRRHMEILAADPKLTK